MKNKRKYITYFTSILMFILGNISFASESNKNMSLDKKPVQLIIPFGPGGVTDLIGRVIQPKLSEELGTTVIINNKPGAGGVIATNYVINSKPDGHTLFLSWDNHTINSIVMKDIPYDIFKDLTPITLMVKMPLIMGAWGGLPSNNLKEFIDLAKNNPGKFNFASIGVGSSNRLHAELLSSLADIDLVHVPYTGGGPAVNAILTGEVAFGFFSQGALSGFLDSGKINAYAVTGSKRFSKFPDIPTLNESGFEGFEAYSWVGIYAPKSTSKEIVEYIYKAFKATVNDKEVRKKLEDLSVEVVAGSPEELDKFQKDDFNKWKNFTKKNNIKFE